MLCSVCLKDLQLGEFCFGRDDCGRPELEPAQRGGGQNAAQSKEVSALRWSRSDPKEVWSGRLLETIPVWGFEQIYDHHPFWTGCPLGNLSTAARGFFPEVGSSRPDSSDGDFITRKEARVITRTYCEGCGQRFETCQGIAK